MTSLKKLTLPIGLATLLAFSHFSHASPPNYYAQGLQAETSGNHSVAIEKYSYAAKQGLSDAKFALGRLYRDIYSDDKNSFKWFMEAAKQGNSFAQYEIGRIYISGSSEVSADKKEAMKWLLSAESHNSSKDVAYALFGLSTSNDKQSWLIKAAKRNHIGAIKELIESYQIGKYGLSIDQEKVALWKQEVRKIEEQDEEGS